MNCTCKFVVDCGINFSSLLFLTVLTVCVDYSTSLFHALCMLVTVHVHAVLWLLLLCLSVVVLFLFTIFVLFYNCVLKCKMLTFVSSFCYRFVSNLNLNIYVFVLNTVFQNFVYFFYNFKKYL